VPPITTIKDRLDTRVRRRLELLRGSAERMALTVAVSGGPDSVALACLLAGLREPLNLELVLAHLHHGLRGPEADGDQVFVEALASELNLPLETSAIDLQQLHKAHGGNLQQLARRRRYAFLREVAARHKTPWIATGHNLDDQAETMLLALIRGGGRRGLSGMAFSRPLGEQTLIRPLLDTSREEILQMLHEERLSYRVDSSNQNLKYRRNRLRRKVLPALHKMNPNLDRTLLQTSCILAEEEAFLEQSARQALNQLTQPPASPESTGSTVLWRGSYTALSQIHPAIGRRIARRLLQTHLPSPPQGLATHTQALLEALQSSQPQWDLTLAENLRFSRRYDSVLLFKGTVEVAQEPIALPDEGQKRIPALGGTLQLKRLERPADLHRQWHSEGVLRATTAYLNGDIIQGGLALRPRRPGDRISPFGLKGTKKVKQIMIEAKLSHEQRTQPRLLTCRNEILWIVGGTINNRYRITEKTKCVLKIEFLGDCRE